MVLRLVKTVLWHFHVFCWQIKLTSGTHMQHTVDGGRWIVSSSGGRGFDLWPFVSIVARLWGWSGSALTILLCSKFNKIKTQACSFSVILLTDKQAEIIKCDIYLAQKTTWWTLCYFLWHQKCVRVLTSIFVSSCFNLLNPVKSLYRRATVAKLKGRGAMMQKYTALLQKCELSVFIIRSSVRWIGELKTCVCVSLTWD